MTSMRRSLVLWIALAACTPTNPRSNEMDAAAGPDGPTLACGTQITDYCSKNLCDRPLVQAKQDRNLCPASITTCGLYDMIARTGTDPIQTHYYQGGQLYAVDEVTLPSMRTCLGGPNPFTVPTCSEQSQTLPACQ
jgi:hypothetical protein